MNPAYANAVFEAEAQCVASRCHDPAYDLMPEDDGEFRWWRTALDFVQLGVADPANGDADEDFVLGRARIVDVCKPQGFRIGLEAPDGVQQHRAHDSAPLPCECQSIWCAIKRLAIGIYARQQSSPICRCGGAGRLCA